MNRNFPPILPNARLNTPIRALLAVVLIGVAIAAAPSQLSATKILAARTPRTESSGNSIRIDSATFSGVRGNYTISFAGSGFGKLSVPLPFTGDLPNFRIGNSAQFLESGYDGDALLLTYSIWTDTNVVVSGFRGQPGDALTVAIWNQNSQVGAAWGGIVPADQTTMKITAVALSGTDKDLRIEVIGSGFGPAPPELSGGTFEGDLNYFRLFDFRAHCGGSSLFEAGFQRGHRRGPNDVTLRYESWSDSRIVVSGFAGAYGHECATYEDGDPIAIVVWKTNDLGPRREQTAWGGSSSQSTPREPAVAANTPPSSEPDCGGAGDEHIRNNTHGTVRILRGTGAFDKVNSGHKTISVAPGAPLNGSVMLNAWNRGPGFAIAPLIYTPSWGDHKTSWRLIGNLTPTTSMPIVDLDLRAPLQPGTYHILFAFQLELDGANVASGTNWSRHGDVWNDGNDLAEFSATQIQSAQRWGCAVDAWLMPEGPQLFYVPVDAIAVEVRPSVTDQKPDQKPETSAKNQNPSEGDQSPLGQRRWAGTLGLPIPANQFWTNTEIQLSPGQVVRIDAGGEIQLGTEGHSTGPEGMIMAEIGDLRVPDTQGCAAYDYEFQWPKSTHALNNLACGSLVGRLGETGPVFEVGAGATFLVTKSAALYLGVNAPEVAHNSGDWSANLELADLDPNSSQKKWAPGQPIGELTMSTSPDSLTPGGLYVISGVVRDVNGEPVAGATVDIAMSFGGPHHVCCSWQHASLLTNKDGSYSKSLQAPRESGQVGITVRVVGSYPRSLVQAGMRVGVQAKPSAKSLPPTRHTSAGKS